MQYTILPSKQRQKTNKYICFPSNKIEREKVYNPVYINFFSSSFILLKSVDFILEAHGFRTLSQISQVFV